MNNLYINLILHSNNNSNHFLTLYSKYKLQFLIHNIILVLLNTYLENYLKHILIHKNPNNHIKLLIIQIKDEHSHMLYHYIIHKNMRPNSKNILVKVLQIIHINNFINAFVIHIYLVVSYILQDHY